jgi:ribosomal protein S18 acetylase RimI-like enzyme
METVSMASTEIEIRRAGVEDAATVARLFRDFNLEFGEPTPDLETQIGYLRPLFESGEITVLLANGDTGFSMLRLRPSPYTGKPEAHLQELYVVPARRSEGIGRALLEATMDAAREAGATGIDLNTGTTDTAARMLYISAGFTNLENAGGTQMLFYEREL